MSEGCVATHASDQPRIASSRLKPSRAEQPDPGSRLLHGVVTFWKYTQRVRCSKLPPVVERLRSWPDAPESSASESTGYRRRILLSAASSLPGTAAPIRRAP